MWKPFFFSLALALPLFIASAEGEEETRKTLLSTITEPASGAFFPFTLREESLLITRPEYRAKNFFTIRGVSEPNATNTVAITTPIPEYIPDFSVEQQGSTLQLTWQRRDPFHLSSYNLSAGTQVAAYSCDDLETEREYIASMSRLCENPPAVGEICQYEEEDEKATLDYADHEGVNYIDYHCQDAFENPPAMPEDFFRVIERNETFALTDHWDTIVDLGVMPDFEVSTSCSYDIYQFSNQENCDLCGEEICPESGELADNGTCEPGSVIGCRACNACQKVGEKTKERTCTTSYGVEYWWNGTVDNQQTDINYTGDPRQIEVRAADMPGTYRYTLWWNETQYTTDQVIEISDISASALSSHLVASSSPLFALSRGGGSTGGNTSVQESPKPQEPDYPPPCNTASGPGEASCSSNECIPPSCPAPPPPRGLHKLEELYVLVDDFEKYEIWYNIEGDEQKPYLPYIGVVRDPSVSTQIELPDDEERNRDPREEEEGARNALTQSASIDLSQLTKSDGTAFDPSTDTVHFALFEVRRIDISNREDPPNNQDDPLDTETPENDEGYLLTHGEEVILGPDGVSTEPAPQKIEFELHNAEVVANEHGEFLVGDFSFLRLNPYAFVHSLFATYTSTDTPFRDSMQSFYIGGTTNPSYVISQYGGQVQASNLFRVQSQPYGTVFDSYTGEPIAQATLSLEGFSTTAESHTIEQTSTAQTGLDGFFSFRAFPGTYALRVEKILGGYTEIFRFPSQHCDRDMTPYNNLHCDAGEDLLLSDEKILQKDIPIDPPIYGVFDNWVYGDVAYITLQRDGQDFVQAWVTPEGKFSFFVPAGEYTIDRLLLFESGEEVSLKEAVQTNYDQELHFSL